MHAGSFIVYVMKQLPVNYAAISQISALAWALSGAWTARGLGAIEQKLQLLPIANKSHISADGAQIEALDTAGAWVLQKLLLRLKTEGVVIQLTGLRPEFSQLLAIVSQQIAEQANQAISVISPRLNLIERIGQSSANAFQQFLAMLAFVGETATSIAKCVAQPKRIRWRPILYNIRSAGYDALSIVGLLSFLLGVVVAYQGAGQLKQYGANIFVADLIGLSMLREFAPLITAIIIAGRSGSAYAAQIGTMAVTEEIDAMRTLGISPQELLVLPKFIALIIAMPLLTVFADVLGVFGGMLMAHAQLAVGFADFLDRFTKAVSVSAFLIGIGKAPVFAAIIVMVGCYQGFRTKGGADSVGRQTTRSVVQSTFLVIVADALFSIAFSVLDL